MAKHKKSSDGLFGCASAHAKNGHIKHVGPIAGVKVEKNGLLSPK